MDVSRLISFNNYTIYYVMNGNYSYYISIPHHKDLRYHISIDLDKYVDILSTDISSMNERIKDIYKDIDGTSMILILPNIERNLLNDIANTEGCINLAKRVIAILNNAHKLLSVNNFTTDDSIYFLDDLTYINFINYFKNKFIGRVHTINLLQILKEFSLSNQGYSASNNAIKINMGGLNYIIGSNEPVKEASTFVDKTKEDYSTSNNDEVGNYNNAYASGNVSYLLLGTLSVVIALILLILLLR